MEVDYLHDTCDLVIGFTDEYNIDLLKIDEFPGKISKSIGFNVKTGEIYVDENIIYKFDFIKEITKHYDLDDSKHFDFNGCFYGIGLSLKTKNFFFSFNGRILNSVNYQTSSEMRY